MAANTFWRWRGLSAGGERVSGTLTAEGRTQALIALESAGVMPLVLRRLTINKAHWQGRYRYDSIAQLATLLKAGLTLSAALQLLASDHPSPQWQALLQCIARQLEQGNALSAVLRQWPEVFTPLYCAMISAGELTGKLEYCCFHLARQQKAQQRLIQQVKKALRYPLMILLMAVLVVIGMAGFVLPEFASIYRTFNAPLPGLTRMVMTFSQAVQHHYAMLGSLAFLPLLLRPLMRRSRWWTMRRTPLLLRLPVVGSLLRGQTLSQIFTLLSLTQNAGIPFLQGLQNVEETLPCPWWRQVIRQIHQDVAEGKPIWQALAASAVFTPLCVQLVRTGEASGALDSLLEELAQHHSEATLQLADGLTTLLEPLLLLVTGTIIGTLVVAMYLPIFQMGDALGGMG